MQSGLLRKGASKLSRNDNSDTITRGITVFSDDLTKRGRAFPKSNTVTKYSDASRAIVKAMLAKCILPRDALPYTDEFESMLTKFQASEGVSVSRVEFWRMLSSIAKDGGLSTGGPRRRAPKTPSITTDEQLEILRLFPEGIGDRDELPYTPKFDELRRRFAASTGRAFSEYEFWRIVSRVAKLARKQRPVYKTAPLGDLDPALVEFLEINNPWWRAMPATATKRYRRWAFAEVVERLESGMASIVALRGSRRVGKSVIQEQLIEELLKIGTADPTRKPVKPARILRVQFDDAPSLGGVGQPILTIVRWYETNILKRTLNSAAQSGEPSYLIFDEVQNLPNWSVQLKILADHNDARILITGSSALRIAAGHDNLAGRLTTIELGPLRLTEIAGLTVIGELPAYAAETPLEHWKDREFWLGLVEHGRRHARLRDRAFRRYSDFGGYPICHGSGVTNPDSLRQQLVNEVITKTIEFDPTHRPGASALDRELLKTTFRMACRYAGQAVHAKRFCQEIYATTGGGIREKQVSEALAFLADSLLLYQVAPLEMLAKKQRHPPKLCICDPFVRNGVLQETVPIAQESLEGCDQAVANQAGHLIESVLGYYLKGIAGLEASWFPARGEEPEVDFVMTIGTNRIPIEVKYRRSQPLASELAGLESFCKKSAYSAPFGLVVTQSVEGPIGERAIAVPAATFLLLR